MTEQPAIVIYTPRITNRLRYVCNHIFKRSLQLDYWFTTDPETLNTDSLIIEYTDQPSGRHPCIPATGLVWEEGIIREHFSPKISGELLNKRLFPQQPSTNALSDFDLFSAVFYCLSIYQAYTPVARDQHGRIDFKEWWLRKNSLDDYPYVDLWIQALGQQLCQRGIQANLQAQPQLRLSFDIDHCWAYKNRTLVRSIKGLGGDILRGRFENLSKRAAVLAGWSSDPYQEFFSWLDHQKGKDIALFFLMREGEKDSLNVWNDEKQKLINRQSQHFQIGLHPSYFVREHPEQIPQELNLLQSSLDTPVKASRQHYLRWNLPDTFMSLHTAGIQQDHSIGYYDQPGFMAATSRPFQFYNLKLESEIKMDFHPFCWMDSMNRYYRSISEEVEWLEIEDLRRKVKEVNGTASLVFHNDSFIIYRYKKILNALSDC